MMSRKNKQLEYKHPVAALVWSFALPGFGQIYNGQLVLGIILVLLELIINQYSLLNISIFYSFHGDFQLGHDVINYQWGMYYPSIWAFSMWHAYNKSISINHYLNEGKNKKIYLTGFFFGGVFGMNLGIYWHVFFLSTIGSFSFLASPVFSGLLTGIAFSFIGHLFEKILLHIRTRKQIS